MALQPHLRQGKAQRDHPGPEGQGPGQPVAREPGQGHCPPVERGLADQVGVVLGEHERAALADPHQAVGTPGQGDLQSQVCRGRGRVRRVEGLQQPGPAAGEEGEHGEDPAGHEYQGVDQVDAVLQRAVAAVVADGCQPESEAALHLAQADQPGGPHLRPPRSGRRPCAGCGPPAVRPARGCGWRAGPRPRPAAASAASAPAGRRSRGRAPRWARPAAGP